MLGTDKEQTLLNPIDTYVELFEMCPHTMDTVRDVEETLTNCC